MLEDSLEKGAKEFKKGIDKVVETGKPLLRQLDQFVGLEPIDTLTEFEKTLINMKVEIEMALDGFKRKIESCLSCLTNHSSNHKKTKTRKK